MVQVINTNSLALTAQKNMNRSQSTLSSAIERLSSGLRINGAKDDAAGQAISNRFTSNINGLGQASRNANDGISLAQTTEGALNEINDNLQNIRRLTVQAKNGTNSASDLQSIQNEINQRLEEINRIAGQTEFNGVKVLSKDQTLSIQVGAHDGQTIDINLSELSVASLGMAGFDVTNTSRAGTGEARQVLTHFPHGVGQAANSQGYQITEDDLAFYSQGIYLVQDTENFGHFIGIKEDGTFYELTHASDIQTAPQITAQSNPAFYQDLMDTFFPGTTTPDPDPNPGPNPNPDPNPGAHGLLETIDNAIAQVDSVRSALGAVQNRFDSVINNIDNTVVNLSASRSRILDADYALEVANMSRAQILQQAGTAMLAQANQAQQNILSLLR